MKHLFIIALLAGCVLLACQKTIDWSLDAVASLAKDSTDNCLPVAAHGVYKVKSPLNDSNYVVIRVIVDSPGDYNIFTNIVNGYSFKASGTFATKGPTDVKLNGYGTPLDIGVNDFIVHLNYSSCFFSVSVLSDSSGAGGNTDTVYSGVSGTLASEQVVNSPAALDFMWYDSTGTKMTEITSNNQPFRKLFYGGANLIDRIDYYTGTGSYTFDHTEKFVYGNNDNVIAILQYAQDGSFEDSLFAFDYDANGKLTKKTHYNPGNASNTAYYSYDLSGNVTTVSLYGGNTALDTLTVEYDTRQNTFNQIYPQYPYLDPAIVFTSSEVNEIFYNSANYPVLITHADGSKQTVTVDTNAAGKPSDIKFDGNAWFVYNYN